MNPIVTICRDCIFCQYKDKQQVGCDFDRIDRYKELINVERVVENDRSFYSFNAVCPLARGIYWEHHDKPDRKKIARKEASISLACIILHDDATMEHFYKTLNSAINQSKPFSQIIIGTTGNPAEFLVAAIEKIGDKAKWDVVSLKNEVLVLKDCPLIYAQWDELIQKCKSQYYTLYMSGDHVNTMTVQAIDHYITDKINRFLVARPYPVGPEWEHEIGPGLVAQTKISELAGGFGRIGLIKKIEDRLQEEVKDGVVHKDKFVTSIQEIMAALRDYVHG